MWRLSVGLNRDAHTIIDAARRYRRNGITKIADCVEFERARARRNAETGGEDRKVRAREQRRQRVGGGAGVLVRYVSKWCEKWTVHWWLVLLPWVHCFQTESIPQLSMI